ncbi:MAG: signal peptide peptidase SppA [Caulobacteraceae bacterium]|nr:signal peptide peptidase SppA [Caulobacteraceae bacterium]
MKQFLLTMAGVFAGLVLFFVGVPFVALVMIAGAAHPSGTANNTVLSLDLRKDLTDQEPQNPFAAFSGRSMAVTTVADVLHRAETDTRVKALFVRLPEGGVTPGEADELRLAFKRFRAAGKPVIVHSQGLYPSGAITSTYMLGASADQFWMQPGAPFQATGLATQDVFFKRLFDKYGVKPDFQQRYEYKNAINGYLYDDYTPAHREGELSWMGSIYQSTVAAAAADRRQSPATLKALIEAGPYDAAQAQAKGLIDRLGQVREAQAEALRRAGPGAKLVDIDDYQAANPRLDGGLNKPVVAVVNAEGDIMTGSNSAGLGSQTINSDDVADALYAAADDSQVKAIVLRLNSPGGSDTASEQILAAVRAAKAKKPVVVSMGAYGASGGYWISSEASAIVAEPTTLTGSIGVFGGKLAIGQTLAHFGVDLRQLSVGGGYANADDPAQPFTPQQQAAFSAAIDRVYDGFVSRVATGRHLPPARVREIARGRVWTGLQAKQLGLVDEVGGFYQALDKAKALAGLAGQDVRLKTVTARRSPFEALQRMFGVSESSLRTLEAAVSVLGDSHARMLLDQASEARVRASPGGGLVLAPLPRF